jgi:hypothetical protein
MASQADGISPSQSPGAVVQISFAGAATGDYVGQELHLETELVEIPDMDAVPDYLGTTQRTPNLGLFSMGSLPHNKNYFRHVASYVQNQLAFRPIRFWLTNAGSVGARDVYIDLSITSEVRFFVVPRSTLVHRPSKLNQGWLIDDNFERTLINEGYNQSSFHFEVKALQPQRVVSPKAELAIGAMESGLINMDVTIFADILSKPIQERLRVRCSVKRSTASALKLMRVLGDNEGSDQSEPINALLRYSQGAGNETAPSRDNDEGEGPREGDLKG